MSFSRFFWKDDLKVEQYLLSLARLQLSGSASKRRRLRRSRRDGAVLHHIVPFVVVVVVVTSMLSSLAEMAAIEDVAAPAAVAHASSRRLQESLVPSSNRVWQIKLAKHQHLAKCCHLSSSLLLVILLFAVVGWRERRDEMERKYGLISLV